MTSSYRGKLQKALDENEQIEVELEKRLTQQYTELESELKKQADLKQKRIELNANKIKAKAYAEESSNVIKAKKEEMAELQRRIGEEERISVQLIEESADLVAKHSSAATNLTQLCSAEIKANSYSNVNNDKVREATKELLMTKAIVQQLIEHGLVDLGKKTKEVNVVPRINDDKASKITFLLNETNTEMKKVLLHKKAKGIPKFWS